MIRFMSLVLRNLSNRSFPAIGFVCSLILIFSVPACSEANRDITTTRDYSSSIGDAESLERGDSSRSVNLCLGQDINTFHCIDNTQFQHCTGDGTFVVKSCPANLCATRTPALGNPCIGRELAAQVDGVEPPLPGRSGRRGNNGQGNNGVVANAPPVVAPPVVTPPPAAATPVIAPPPPVFNNGGNNAQCVGGPAFDPAGVKNIGNGAGLQFIGGQCLSSADCASGCCANPCGICSGVGAQFQAGKLGCGFGD